MQDGTTLRELEALIQRLGAGDTSARDAMINIACRRLTILTRKLLNNYERLRQWEQTDDVFQGAAMRLRQTLESVSPASAREFFGLASLQIRRELMDLVRVHYGRSGNAPRFVAGSDQLADAEVKKSDDSPPESRNAGWQEFYEKIETLPPAEQELVSLLFFHELSQEEAAEILKVDKSTVKRRWRVVRLKLAELLKAWNPSA